MTEAPIWPGVTEYLYQAARPGWVDSDGTAIVPSGLTPRCSSAVRTPMAGIATDTGSDRGSDGLRFWPDGPVAPAAARDAWGACPWAVTTTPTTAAPATMRSTPATPGTQAPGRPGPGGETALRPGHDHAEASYPALLATPDTVASLRLPQDGLI